MSSMQVKEEDFPSLYQVADKASLKAQQYYTCLIKADLVLVVAGSLLSSFSAGTHEGKAWCAILGAAMLAIAFVISLALKFMRYEKTWYGARAVAESVKSLSWKYMIGADPLGQGVSDVDKTFTTSLSDLMLEKNHLAFDYEAEKHQGLQITDKMRQVRASTISIRKETFLSERLINQKSWYSGKAGFNRKKEKAYFLYAVCAQFLGLLAALYLIKEPETRNLTGFFSTLAVSFFSWMQIKKFQELAQSYALTAQELGMIEARAGSIKSNPELGTFVSDTENAISREHTMWVARRGQ